MSGTREVLDTLLDGVGTKVAFAAQGLSHAIVTITGVLSSHDDRITALEAKCTLMEPGPAAHYDPPAEAAAGDSSQNAPAAPPAPASPSNPPILPDQANPSADRTIVQPRTAAGRANRQAVLDAVRRLGGHASVRQIREHAGIVGNRADHAAKMAVRDGALIDTGERAPSSSGPPSPIYALPGSIDETAPVTEPVHAVSPRVRRELERSARQAAGQDLPAVRTEHDASMSQLRRALTNGPRDAHQLAQILGVPVRAAVALMIAGHRDHQITVQDGVARLL